MDRPLDKRPSDSPAPKCRFDKQPVELTAHLGHESCDTPIKFGNEYLTARDMFGRQVNGIGIGFQMRPVSWVGQRRAALQFFQRFPLLRQCRTDAHQRAFT